MTELTLKQRKWQLTTSSDSYAVTLSGDGKGEDEITCGNVAGAKSNKFSSSYFTIQTLFNDCNITVNKSTRNSEYSNEGTKQKQRPGSRVYG